MAGLRTRKYKLLSTRNLHTIDWSELSPQTPYYLFRPQSGASLRELDGAPLIHDVFLLKSEAVKTNRDHFVIGDSDEEILKRILAFIDPEKTTSTVKKELALKDNAQWSVDGGRRECRATFDNSHLAAVAYRPFDNRRIYYHPSVVFNPRPVLADNVLGRENLVFVTSRRIRTDVHAHFYVTDKIVMKEMLSSADNCNGYPLYRFDSSFGREQRLTNFTPGFLRALTARLGLKQSGELGLPTGLTPEDIFYYIYAVFHSPSYRSRYAEFLRIDFPRLPITGDLELFCGLGQLGGELTNLHLLKSPKLTKITTEFIGGQNPKVEKSSWSRNTVWIDNAQTIGFTGVREDVWNFRIGSYQVCEKWLKNRKGRTLSRDDIAHYQKIIVALAETIRLMKEVDKVIEQYGGWPQAFATPDNETHLSKVAEPDTDYQP